jgi:hypothetical protein
MKGVFAVVAALAAVALAHSVAQATTTQTVHLDGVPIDVGPAACIPGDLVISGNGVLHTTVNDAGDSWTTGTLEGSVSSTDPSSGYTGHAAAWFGVEDNNRNLVNHFIANSVGTLGDGTPLTIHVEGQFTINAQGLPVVTRVTATCS